MRFHPGRPDRHAWHREANGRRPLSQQAPDGPRRDVPFDNKSVDFGRMAGGQ